ncbi:hypothetical protein HK405_010134 [Cladochytrium tenue]|nr:hypothetical protein HK405_010134 [Cladochytrium tenue]
MSTTGGGGSGGGGGILVSLRLEGRDVLVVGLGKETPGRVRSACEAGARVVLLAPPGAELDAATQSALAGGHARLVEGWFRGAEDLAVHANASGSGSGGGGGRAGGGSSSSSSNGSKLYDVVLGCSEDADEMRRVGQAARAARVPVNCADVPPLCDFYFAAAHRDGPLQVAVSTGGCGPRMAARVRDLVKAALPDGAGAAVAAVGRLREKVHAADAADTAAAAPRRMRWVSRLCDEWPLEALARLTPEDEHRIVEVYRSGAELPPPPPPFPSSQSPSSQALVPLGSQASLAARAGRFFTAIGTLALRPLLAALRASHSFVRATWVALGLRGPSLLTWKLPAGRIQFPASASAAVRRAAAVAAGEAEGSLGLLRRGAAGDGPTLYLVGAGPGDPGLLTLNALRVLQAADVVVSDRLVAREILDAAVGPRARLVFVERKADGRSDVAQADANAVCVTELQRLRDVGSGGSVVRLKGGDAFVYGRGAEEALHVGAAGFRVVVVPGISSCVAAPASAGIPVTHRGAADQLLVATARGEAGAPPDLPPFSPRRTVVVLMPVARLAALTAAMIQPPPGSAAAAAAYPPSTPAAVVEKGTCEGERVVEGTLADIAARAVAAGVGSPSLLVVGAVCGVLRGQAATTLAK